jgi:hypothetical protein
MKTKYEYRDEVSTLAYERGMISAIFHVAGMLEEKDKQIQELKKKLDELTANDAETSISHRVRAYEDWINGYARDFS